MKFNILALLILISFGLASCGNKTCQCTTVNVDGTMFKSEKYEISTGDCSDSNSDLIGVVTTCIEVK